MENQLSSSCMPAGTDVMTSDGVLPVEYLQPGDRIITQRGFKALLTIEIRRYSGPVTVVRKGVIGPNRPRRSVILLEGALLLHWSKENDAAAARLNKLSPIIQALGEEATMKIDVSDMPFYDLRFAMNEIIHLDGVKLFCGTGNGSVAKLALSQSFSEPE